MASHYERTDSPYYWIRLMTADRKWVGKSSGIRKDAPGALRKIHQRVAEETAREERLESDGSRAMFKNWVPRWFEHHYTNELSRKRAMNCWAHLSIFMAKKKVHHPEEVTYGFCHEFMKWRTDAKACGEEGRRLGNWNTALTEIRILGTIMQEAVSQGWVLSNPCARLGLGRRDVKEKNAIEPAEQKKIEKALQDAPGWMQDSWLVGIKQGNRLTECQVPMNRIDTKLRAITFRVKGGALHTAPLHADLLPLVERRRNQNEKLLVELPPNASRDWNVWFTEHGFEHLSYHCLRVTVITRLAQQNVTAEKAMQYVGHCTEMAHAIYRKLKPKDVAELGDLL